MNQQTLNFDLPASQWEERQELILSPIRIPAYYWSGGTIRLHIPNLRDVFRETCCYQLELRAYKRTIVSCNYSAAYQNLSEYSLTVIV